MTEYDENGFLSGRIETWIKEYQESNREILNRAQELNRDCHHFLDGRSIDLNDQKQAVSCVLFARILELYQAIIVVAQRGMIAPTQIMFRSFLEAMFHFFAIQKDPKYLDEYLDQFHIQRKKLVNKVHKSNSPQLDGLRQAIDDQLLEEIKQSVEELGIKPISIEDVAKRAECHDIYLIVYPLLCRAVHTSASALDSHVRFNKDTQEIEGFIYGPSPIETVRVIGLGGLWLAEALGEVSKLFEEDRSDLCESHKEAFQALLPEK